MESQRFLSRAEHPISRESMPSHVLKVLYRLKASGYMGLLVGGALRDLYRDREPRDFDVATDAPLHQIREMFRNSKTIGKRFPIVHAYFGNDVVEISSLKGEDGLGGYDLIQADAMRRDFTANAVFYNIDGFSVIDPLNAIPDIREGRVVCIGDPDEKFSEDAVRILRGLKLVAKQGFTLDPELERAIVKHVPGLTEMGPGRKYEETTRILLDRSAPSILALCQRYGVLAYLWPQGKKLLRRHGLAYFDTVRDSIPVTHTRGSFSKATHTLLWLRLFLDSPLFEPHTDPNFFKTQFERFLEPMAMPFRAPIIESLVCISHMLLEPDRKPAFRFSKEVQQLLHYYIQHVGLDTPEPLVAYIKAGERRERPPAPVKSERSRRRRRRGPRGGRNNKNATPQG